MKKIWLIIMLVSVGLLFGCGGGQSPKGEETEKPQVEQESEGEEATSSDAEIDFEEYANIIRILGEEDGFISMNEYLDTDIKLINLVNRDFSKKMMDILNHFNKEYDDIGLPVDEFNKKIESEKK